jgi:hypothetical protein
MLRRVALIRTDVSEERSASIIRVTIIGELGTTPAVTINRRPMEKIQTPRKSEFRFVLFNRGLHEKRRAANLAQVHLLVFSLLIFCA